MNLEVRVGGYGSGYRWSKKTTVEECRSIDAQWLGRTGTFQSPTFGSLKWANGSSVGYFVRQLGEGRYIFELSYTFIGVDGTLNESIREPITVERVDLPIGGSRWYFRCPGRTQTGYCGRRVRKIHKPPGNYRRYGCRHCYDLTYSSCQNSNKYRPRGMSQVEYLLARIEAKWGRGKRRRH